INADNKHLERFCLIRVHRRSSAANYCLHRCHRIATSEIGGAFLLPPITGENQHGARPRPPPTFDVGGFITHEVGRGQVDVVRRGRRQYHAGFGFTAIRRNAGSVRAIVRVVNQVSTHLAQELILHRKVLRLGDQAPADAALIGDDEDAEPGFFEAADRLGHTGKDLDPCGVAAVVGVLHEGAIAIEEDGAAQVSWHGAWSRGGPWKRPARPGKRASGPPPPGRVRATASGYPTAARTRPTYRRSSAPAC